MIYEHLQGRRILLLVGHCNNNWGTKQLSCNGDTFYTSENEINLDIVLSLARDLKLHSDDKCEVFVGHGTWHRRSRLAKLYNPDVVMEIHCNGYRDPEERGHEVWVGSDKLSEELAECIIKAVSEGHPIPPHGHPDSKPVRGIHHIYLENNKRRALFEHIPERPLVLVECGYLTNPEDCKLLTSMPVQDIIALKIGLGLNAFFAPTLPTDDDGAGTGEPTEGATGDTPYGD